MTVDNFSINNANIYSKTVTGATLDPKTQTTIERVKDEICVQLAKRKVECLQDVLTWNGYTQQERNELQAMLNDAQKEFDFLKKKFNVSG